ncbi:MAG: hypothetical protein GF353_11755 [Candidatus Lokiarchaeota archaeon]|nr:hypothetical protein [Candidatus Lokiarchaeota archaeon]
MRKIGKSATILILCFVFAFSLYIFTPKLNDNSKNNPLKEKSKETNNTIIPEEEIEQLNPPPEDELVEEELKLSSTTTYITKTVYTVAKKYVDGAHVEGVLKKKVEPMGNGELHVRGPTALIGNEIVRAKMYFGFNNPYFNSVGFPDEYKFICKLRYKNWNDIDGYVEVEVKRDDGTWYRIYRRSGLDKEDSFKDMYAIWSSNSRTFIRDDGTMDFRVIGYSKGEWLKRPSFHLKIRDMRIELKYDEPSIQPSSELYTIYQHYEPVENVREVLAEGGSNTGDGNFHINGYTDLIFSPSVKGKGYFALNNPVRDIYGIPKTHRIRGTIKYRNWNDKDGFVEFYIRKDNDNWYKLWSRNNLVSYDYTTFNMDLYTSSADHVKDDGSIEFMILAGSKAPARELPSFKLVINDLRVQFIYDNTPPIIVINQIGGTGQDSNPGQWYIYGYDQETGIDPSSIKIYIDGVLTGTSFGYYAIPNIIGTHCVQVEVKNNNPFGQSKTIKKICITIIDDDITPPWIDIIYYGSGNDGNPGYWNVYADDAQSGIDGRWIYIDNVPQPNNMGFYPYYVPNSLGLHSIRAIVKNNDYDRGDIDRETNQASSSIRIVDDDTSGPIITINYIDGEETDGSPGKWSVSASDPESGVGEILVYIDDILIGTHVGLYNVPNDLGVHTIRVIAKNSDIDRGISDQETSIKQSEVSINDDDITPPMISYIYTGDGTDGNPGTIIVSASDESGLLVDPSGEYTVPNSLGVHSFVFEAEDNDLDRLNDNLRNNISVEIEITDDDTTAPWINIIYHGDETDNNPGYWNVYSEDSESGLAERWVSVNGVDQPGDMGSYPYYLPNKLGIHTIIVIIKNNDNDRGEIDKEMSFNYSNVLLTDDDISGPLITIDYIDGDETDETPGKWNVSANDPESGIKEVLVYIDDVLKGTQTGLYNVPNNLGLHTIRVLAKNGDLDRGTIDQEINENKKEVTIVDDDITPPIINYIYTGDGTDGNPGTIIVFASDESGLLIDPSGEYTVPNSLGVHSFIFKAEDNDSDRSHDSLNNTLTVFIEIIDDDTIPPTINLNYAGGDGSDANPGHFEWDISDFDDGLGGDGDTGFNELFITISYVSSEGLPNYSLTIEDNKSGSWCLDPYLGTYSITILARDNDDDRAIILDSLVAEITKSQEIIDDDTIAPNLSNLTISHDIHYINISVEAEDQSGISEFSIYIDEELIEPLAGYIDGDTFVFIFENKWILKNKIYEILVLATDNDNDRPNDELNSSIAGQFEIMLEDMYEFVCWQLEDLKEYISDNLCWIFSWLLDCKLSRAQKELQRANCLIEKQRNSRAIIRDMLAKIYVELAECRATIFSKICMIPEEDSNYIISYLRQIRNNIVILMGASTGEELGYNIALIEIDLLDLKDLAEDELHYCSKICISRSLESAINCLECSIFKLSLGCNIKYSLTRSQWKLDKTSCKIIRMLKWGQLSEELAIKMLSTIDKAQNDIEILKNSL